MTISNETAGRVEKVVWQVGDRIRDTRSPLKSGDFASCAAFIALVRKEDQLPYGTPLEDSIKARLHAASSGAFVCDLLKDEGARELVDELYGGFSLEELRQIVLHYSDIAQMGHYAFEKSTSDSVIDLARAVLDIHPGERVADFCCGLGHFLVDVAAATNGIECSGIDADAYAAALTDVRLAVAGVSGGILTGDLFATDAEGEYDKIFSNPPFGLRLSLGDKADGSYATARGFLEEMGKPSSADWLFCRYISESLAPEGTGVAIATNGAMVNGGDAQARRYFIEHGLVRAVVALPGKLFAGTAVPAVLLVLGRNDGAIRVVDATDLSVPGRRWDTMGEVQIGELLGRLDNDGDSSRLVGKDELEATDYCLYPPRYLGRSIELQNATKLADLVLEIERGSGMVASELDDLTVDEDTGIHYLRLSDIVDGRIGDDLPCLHSLDQKTRNQWLRTGDLIISKNGNPFKIAVAEVPQGRTIIANGNLYIVRLDTNRVDPYFVAAFLASPDGVELLDRLAVGTTIRNLPLKNLKELQVPLPSLEDQEDVANRFRSSLDRIGELKAELDIAREGAASAYRPGGMPTIA